MSLPRLQSPRVLSIPREIGLLGLIAITVVVCSIAYPRAFPTFGNFAAVMRNLALDGILATGMMMMMVGGAFDLSVGGLFSMIGIVTGWLMKEAGFPVPVAVLAGLGLGFFGGFLNGVIVAKVKVNPLITTLGTMGIFRGVAVLVGGPGITFLPESFNQLGQGKILGMQVPFWIMLVVAALFHYLLRHTRYFRQYYYIGNNARAAHLSGINVVRLKILAFSLMGLLSGFAGILFSARIGTSVSIAGDGAELRVITAVILGGASLTGGKGTIAGALIGVVFIALINNVLIIASVSSYWQSIVIGVVLVMAVAMDSIWSRNSVATH